jgi:hypothetical protein
MSDETRSNASEMAFDVFGGGPLSRAKQWLLIRGDRRKVVVLFFVIVYTAFVAMTLAWPDFGQMLKPQNPNNLDKLFTTLLSGVILLVSIVTSINSLTISQELTPIGSQHERVSDLVGLSPEGGDHHRFGR